MANNRHRNASRPAPAPPAVTESDRRQDRRITWSLIGAAASFLVSLASTCFSCVSWREAAEANAIARAAQERASGKVQARFEYASEKERDPDRLKQFMRTQDGFDRQVFRIDDAQELMRWGPTVSIKNTGTEPIDAVKVNVHYIAGAAYGVGVKQITPAPIVVNDATSYESADFGKLMPGKSARLVLSSLLLNQITRLKWRDFSEKDHAGIFTLEVLCRLVGSSSYDRMEGLKPIAIEFHWRPPGFKQDGKDVQELLQFKPSVILD